MSKLVRQDPGRVGELSTQLDLETLKSLLDNGKIDVASTALMLQALAIKLDPRQAWHFTNQVSDFIRGLIDSSKSISDLDDEIWSYFSSWSRDCNIKIPQTLIDKLKHGEVWRAEPSIWDNVRFVLQPTKEKISSVLIPMEISLIFLYFIYTLPDSISVSNESHFIALLTLIHYGIIVGGVMAGVSIRVIKQSLDEIFRRTREQKEEIREAIVTGLFGFSGFVAGLLTAFQLDQKYADKVSFNGVIPADYTAEKIISVAIPLVVCMAGWLAVSNYQAKRRDARRHDFFYSGKQRSVGHILGAGSKPVSFEDQERLQWPKETDDLSPPSLTGKGGELAGEAQAEGAPKPEGVILKEGGIVEYYV